MYDPLAIATFFINRSLSTGIQLTPMKLVKLSYIAHGWYLAFKEEPLLSEGVQAWKFGPVVPTVYHAYKEFGKDQILRVKTVGLGTHLDITPHSDEWNILERVWNAYKDFTGVELSTMTHQPGTPWDTINKQFNGDLPSNAIIPNDIIKKHYKELRNVRQHR
jgi:uncharacterized phage-associated protein